MNFRKRIFIFVPLLIAVLVQTACGTPAAKNKTGSESPFPVQTLVAQPTRDLVATLENNIAGLGKAVEPDPDIAGLAGAPSIQTDEERFIRFVEGRLNSIWSSVFLASGLPYRELELLIFRTDQLMVPNAEATHTSGGPIYIYETETVYFPLPYLWNQAFPDPSEIGDFAYASVIAHEFGHHIQKLLGYADEINPRRRVAEILGDQILYNELTTNMELQADCFAGIFAHGEYLQGTLDDTDMTEATRITALVGDDFMSGETDPQHQTHGSGVRRAFWFNLGYVTGDPKVCDPFSPRESSQTINTPATQPPTEIPSRTSSNPITDFFVLASQSECEPFNDDFENTINTIQCDLGDALVSYDEWVSEQAWMNEINNLRETRDLLLDDTWQGKQSNHRGPYIAWETDDGTVVMVWGVNGQRLSGMAWRSDGDLDALYSWWATDGSRHYLP